VTLLSLFPEVFGLVYKQKTVTSRAPYHDDAFSSPLRMGMRAEIGLFSKSLESAGLQKIWIDMDRYRDYFANFSMAAFAEKEGTTFKGFGGKGGRT
jgi:5-enolpyruvylshikimate-3-phosphate synthase